MKYIIIISLLFINLSVLHAQDLENIISFFDGERVTVTYDLKSKNSDQRFNVLVYGSHDNYSRELVVAGEAGKNVAPGLQKKIVWEAKQFLPASFNADVQVKIVVTPHTEFSVLNFETLSRTSYKTGRKLSVKWTGGNPNDKLDLELLQDNSRKQVVATTLQNNGTYNWKIPKDLKGKNYSLRLVTSGTNTSNTESETFNIKSNTSPAWFIIPAVLVGGGAAYIVSGGEIGD
jgi:hypothetical protein